MAAGMSMLQIIEARPSTISCKSDEEKPLSLMHVCGCSAAVVAGVTAGSEPRRNACFTQFRCLTGSLTARALWRITSGLAWHTTLTLSSVPASWRWVTAEPCTPWFFYAGSGKRPSPAA